ARLDGDAFDKAIGAYLSALAHDPDAGSQARPQAVSVDGKTLRLRHEVARCEWMTLRRPG
ncbi:hypothetical protein HGB48_37070, partial [Actinomadura latina]|nr:hypothetical protein [Actinomadura latina]